MASASVIEAESRVSRVHIDGLAVLKIVKHCQESLPSMVTGSLLGLEAGDGVLEITHAFPFPDGKDSSGDLAAVKDAGGGDEEKASGVDEEAAAALDGHEFQLEMMKMLREVNVDNNCVGWYQSMYLGSYSTAALLESQLNYQTELSANAVVVLYDPMQTSHGELTLRCYRLTDEAVEMKRSGVNTYIDPRGVFESIPVTLTNPGLVKALLRDVSDARSTSAPGGMGDGDTSFDRLDLSSGPYLEKHMSFLCTWVDDLSAEQNKFQYYTRNLVRNSSSAQASGGDRGNRNKKKNKLSTDESREGWAKDDAPRRLESLLISNQIRGYCDQVDKFAEGGFGKLFLTGGLHKE